MNAPPDSRRGVRSRTLSVLTLALISAAISACSSNTVPSHKDPESDGVAWFEDATEAWGINFTHDPGPLGTYFTPQSMGSGAAAFDFDGDGLLDLYLLHFGGPKSTSTNRLLRQTAPGKFADVSDGSGLDVPGHCHGVAIGDINNDGKPDVLVTMFDGIKLFLNLGGGKFRDATQEAGLVNLCWAASAAFLDYDRDGWLDLMVVNYLDFDPSKECWSLTGARDYCGPRSFPSVASKLFHNLGSPAGQGGRPKFKDVSFESGIGRATAAGLGVVCADFNRDGWVDIFVANDGNPNYLWINKKNGTFVDEAVSRGVAYTEMGKAYAGMGIGVGDVNNDGLLDLYVTHLGSETNILWRQVSPGLFEDKTGEAGLHSLRRRGTGFGALMADFNNDGAVDIAVANGRVFYGGSAKDTGMGFWETYLDKNQLFENDGTGKFGDISSANKSFCDYWNVGRGLVAADFDNDGGVDLVIVPLGGKAKAFRNVAADRGHWLKVKAIDPKRNRDAYGAEIRVRAGGKSYFRVLSPAESYLCSGPAIAHFGLGKHDRIDAIEVTWPDGDGAKEIFEGGAANRTVTLRRGEGRKP
ncbi:MAG TPA: CRTAC1 family protein [Gemmataceae bacterium]